MQADPLRERAAGACAIQAGAAALTANDASNETPNPRRSGKGQAK